MSTREIIIEILGQHWPLSPKEIHSNLKQFYNISVSYHTVYEILQDLTILNIVNRFQKKYQLNHVWIEKQLNTFQRINQSYKQKSPIAIIEKNSIQLKVFSIKELHQQLIVYISTQENPQQELYLKCRHLWGSFYTSKTLSVIKKASANRSYALVQFDTPLSREISGFYKKIGTKIVMGEKFNAEYEALIFGSMTISIYYPEKLVRSVDKLFFETTKLNLTTVRKIKSLFEEHHEINLLITRYKDIADINKRSIRTSVLLR